MIRSFFLLVFAAVIAHCSLSAQPAGAEYQQQIEKAILTGGLDAHVEKHLRTLGDEGSIEIARAIEDKQLTAPQMELVLVLLRASFADQDKIADVPNRRPQVALLILRYIEVTAGPGASLQRSINETRDLLRGLMPKVSN